MKKITNVFGLILIVCMFTSSIIAQVSVNNKDCLGVWKTIDDETGRTKSHVKIFKKGNNYHAKIIKLLDPQSLKDSGEKRFEDIKCDKCPADHGKDQSMVGIEMIWDMYKTTDKWKGGSIMDPKKGKVYGCTMWMDDEDKTGNTLKVRGWVAFIYRTQTWHRIE